MSSKYCQQLQLIDTFSSILSSFCLYENVQNLYDQIHLRYSFSQIHFFGPILISRSYQTPILPNHPKSKGIKQPLDVLSVYLCHCMKGPWRCSCWSRRLEQVKPLICQFHCLFHKIRRLHPWFLAIITLHQIRKCHSQWHVLLLA